MKYRGLTLNNWPVLLPILLPYAEEDIRHALPRIPISLFFLPTFVTQFELLGYIIDIRIEIARSSQHQARVDFSDLSVFSWLPSYPRMRVATTGDKVLSFYQTVTRRFSLMLCTTLCTIEYYDFQLLLYVACLGCRLASFSYANLQQGNMSKM